jgi:hypothetical protein
MWKIFWPLFDEKCARKFVILDCWLLLLSIATAAYSAEPPSPLGAVTVNDFLAACRFDASSCSDRIGGALLNKFAVDTGEVCLLSADYAKAVPIWLSAHPETFGMATNDGIYGALKALYPC